MPAPRVSVRVVGIGIALIGILLLGVAGWRLNRAFALASGQEVTARVTESDPAAGTVTVRFNDLSGTKREPVFARGKAFAAKHPRGARLDLVYLQDDPEVVVLKGEGPQASSVVVWFGIGVLVAGLGAVLIVRVPGKPAG